MSISMKTYEEFIWHPKKKVSSELNRRSIVGICSYIPDALNRRAMSKRIVEVEVGYTKKHPKKLAIKISLEGSSYIRYNYKITEDSKIESFISYVFFDEDEIKINSRSKESRELDRIKKKIDDFFISKNLFS